MLAVPVQSTHHVMDIEPGDEVSRVRPIRELMQWENGGYFILRPEIFSVLREGEDMVPDGFDRLLPERRLIAQRYTGFWRAADTFKDRAELEELYRSARCPWMLWDPHRHGSADPRSDVPPGSRDGWRAPPGSQDGWLAPPGSRDGWLAPGGAARAARSAPVTR